MTIISETTTNYITKCFLNDKYHLGENVKIIENFFEKYIIHIYPNNVNIYNKFDNKLITMVWK